MFVQSQLKNTDTQRGTGHYLCGGGEGGGGEIMGWARPIFFREKGWAKREFHDDWGWVIVCVL